MYWDDRLIFFYSSSMSTYPFSSDIVLLSSLLLSFASLSEAPLPLLIDYHSIDSLNSYVRYPYHYVISCLRRCVSPLANTLLLFSLIIMIAHLLAYDLWALTLLWLHFSCPFFRFFPTVYICWLNSMSWSSVVMSARQFHSLCYAFHKHNTRHL